MSNSYAFNDIIKKSIYKLGVFEKVSGLEVLFCLIVTFAIAMFIFYIYKTTFRGVVYSYTYNISIVLMSLITATVILTIGSNVVLSLGMVGALSIVRFRTAVKDPMDIVFMFWAIAVGIACGAGIYPIAVVGSLFIGLALIILTKYSISIKRYILIIHYIPTADENVRAIINKLKYTIKSKTVTKNEIELSIELRLKTDNSQFVNELSTTEGVRNASLIAYNGEYAS